MAGIQFNGHGNRGVVVGHGDVPHYYILESGGVRGFCGVEESCKVIETASAATRAGSKRHQPVRQLAKRPIRLV